MTLKTLAQGLVFVAITAIVFFRPQEALAIDNPSSYYDWNSYQPQEKVLGTEVRAQEEANPTEDIKGQEAQEDHKKYKQHDYFLDFTSSLTPSSPLYFAKKFEEHITLAFTFNGQRKEELRVESAGERLEEIEKATADGKISAVESATNSYQTTVNKLAEELSDLKAGGSDITNLSTSIDEEISKHKLILDEVAMQLPENAEDSLKEAIVASEKAIDAVADVQGKPAVPEEVAERLQALKAVGILSHEEVAKLVGAATRQQAREEMRKYVEESLIPESDFIKFDQTAAVKFPRAFYVNLEVKKFKELKTLETEKPDEQTLNRVQQFAKEYKPGESVPPDIRRWWVPMVRLEELQNTIRPDLIPQNFLRNRPEEYQKYQEVVEKVKPKKEDLEYVNKMIQQNPNLLNDPSYARIKALADKFGSTEGGVQDNSGRAVEYCGTDSHWVNIPYMPQGGYCVPNYDFPAPGNGSEKACPSGYHKPFPGAACYSDNPNQSRGGISTAPGTCPAGYNWVTGSRGSDDGYCAPKAITDGGGFPSPIYTVGYCLPGQTFVDGKCETYNSPPKEGCTSGRWWNGSQCIQQKDCGQGSYQDRNGECKQSTSNAGAGRVCPAPPGGCGFNSLWDSVNCSCRSTLDPRPDGNRDQSGTPGRDQQEANCRAGGGTCVSWVNGACGCERSSGSTGGNSTGGSRCGDGYDWNGSYCYPRGGSGGGAYSSGNYTGGSNYSGTGSGNYSGGGSYSGSGSGGSYSGGGYSGGSYSGGNYSVGSSGSGSYSPPTGYNPPAESQPVSQPVQQSAAPAPVESAPAPQPVQESAPAPAPAESQ